MAPGTNELFVAPLCHVYDPCYSLVIEELLNSSSLIKKYCSECTQPCSITNFIIHTSSLSAPPKWQMNEIKKFVENSTVPLSEYWSTAWREYIYESYVAVSVVRESAVVKTNTQGATIGPVDVLSNIGGQTGLWIGISFLSLMEITEMLYRLVRYQCQKILLTIRK